MEFSRQEYWSGLPCLLPGDLPDPRIKLLSPAFQTDSLPSEALQKEEKGGFLESWAASEGPSLPQSSSSTEKKEATALKYLSSEVCCQRSLGNPLVTNTNLGPQTQVRKQHKLLCFPWHNWTSSSSFPCHQCLSLHLSHMGSAPLSSGCLVLEDFPWHEMKGRVPLGFSGGTGSLRTGHPSTSVLPSSACRSPCQAMPGSVCLDMLPTPPFSKVLIPLRMGFCLKMRCVCVLSHSVVSYSLWPHRLQPARLLCPWNFPAKNTGAGCHFLLQGLFPTQGSNSHLLCLLH